MKENYLNDLKVLLPWWLRCKESACNAGDPGSIPGWGRSPGEGNGNPLQYSGLEKPMDRGALAGCSPWCHKESDTTERLTLYPNLKQLRPLHLSVGKDRLM